MAQWKLINEGAVEQKPLDNLTLRLFTNDYTPDKNSEYADFTFASGGGSDAKTLTQANWVANIVTEIAQFAYPEQSWTFTGAGTYYGVAIVNSNNKVQYAARFDSPWVFTSEGGEGNISPVLQFFSECALDTSVSISASPSATESASPSSSPSPSSSESASPSATPSSSPSATPSSSISPSISASESPSVSPSISASISSSPSSSESSSPSPSEAGSTPSSSPSASISPSESSSQSPSSSNSPSISPSESPSISPSVSNSPSASQSPSSSVSPSPSSSESSSPSPSGASVNSFGPDNFSDGTLAPFTVISGRGTPTIVSQKMVMDAPSEGAYTPVSLDREAGSPKGFYIEVQAGCSGLVDETYNTLWVGVSPSTTDEATGSYAIGFENYIDVESEPHFSVIVFKNNGVLTAGGTGSFYGGGTSNFRIEFYGATGDANQYDIVVKQGGTEVFRVNNESAYKTFANLLIYSTSIHYGTVTADNVVVGSLT